jgi:hypothetical protein
MCWQVVADFAQSNAPLHEDGTWLHMLQLHEVEHICESRLSHAAVQSSVVELELPQPPSAANQTSAPAHSAAITPAAPRTLPRLDER